MISRYSFSVVTFFALSTLQVHALPAMDLGSSLPENLIQESALVTAENRVPRKPEDLGPLEASQGRVWCFQKKNVPSDFSNIKKWRKTLEIGGNGSLFYDKDVVIFSRHIFVNTKRVKLRPENCFFEHLSSGEFIRFTTNVQYKAVEGSIASRYQLYLSEDYALAQLSRAPSNGPANPVQANDVMFHISILSDYRLHVASNLADNYDEKSKDYERASITPTYTHEPCFAKTRSLVDGVELNVYYTDCNTGSGTSGSLVFMDVGTQKKVVGVISAQQELAKPGSGFDSVKLHTVVTQLDYYLITYLYDQLKSHWLSPEAASR